MPLNKQKKNNENKVKEILTLEAICVFMLRADKYDSDSLIFNLQKIVRSDKKQKNKNKRGEGSHRGVKG